MKQYCMKCGFATAYQNFLPPEKCGKCGFSLKLNLSKQEAPKKVFDIPVPDLDLDTVSNLGKKSRDFSRREFKHNGLRLPPINDEEMGIIHEDLPETSVQPQDNRIQNTYEVQTNVPAPTPKKRGRPPKNKEKVKDAKSITDSVRAILDEGK